MRDGGDGSDLEVIFDSVSQSGHGVSRPADVGVGVPVGRNRGSHHALKYMRSLVLLVILNKPPVISNGTPALSFWTERRMHPVRRLDSLDSRLHGNESMDAGVGSGMTVADGRPSRNY